MYYIILTFNLLYWQSIPECGMISVISKYRVTLESSLIVDRGKHYFPLESLGADWIVWKHCYISRGRNLGDDDGIMAKQRGTPRWFFSDQKGRKSASAMCYTTCGTGEMVKKHHSTACRGREGKMDRGCCEGLNYKDESRCQ